MSKTYCFLKEDWCLIKTLHYRNKAILSSSFESSSWRNINESDEIVFSDTTDHKAKVLWPVGQVDTDDDLWFLFSTGQSLVEEQTLPVALLLYFHQTLGWRLLQPLITPSTNLFIFLCSVFNLTIKM